MTEAVREQLIGVGVAWQRAMMADHRAQERALEADEWEATQQARIAEIAAAEEGK